MLLQPEDRRVREEALVEERVRGRASTGSWLRVSTAAQAGALGQNTSKLEISRLQQLSWKT